VEKAGEGKFEFGSFKHYATFSLGRKRGTDGESPKIGEDHLRRKVKGKKKGVIPGN